MIACARAGGKQPARRARRPVRLRVEVERHFASAWALIRIGRPAKATSQ